MHFTKIHGLGNDYLYVFGDVPENIEELSIKLSERHTGAGSDGMIYITPSDKADFGMRIFNADGSEAKMCGNGIRCVGKYVYDKGYTDKKKLSIETQSGIKYLDLAVAGGKVIAVSVDMGQAEVSNDMSLCVDNKSVICTPVSVGNPHAVIFCEDAEAIPLEKLGSRIEKHEKFPGGVNVEFVSKIGENQLRMRVWERGSGITMACGTGACASVAAAVSKGLCDYDTPVSVTLDGGVLEIEISRDFGVIMRGPAEFVYEGDTIC